MCTLIILSKIVHGYPLVIAANRDEYRSRETKAPSLWEDNPNLFAGKDLKAGGTWLGVNRRSLLVGVLNRRSEKGTDSSRRSRGLLCLEALKFSHLEQVRELMGKPLKETYNPFNLFYADCDRAFVTHCQEEQRTIEVSPGFHFLANGDMDDANHPRLKKVMELTENIETLKLDEAIGLLKSLCNQHAETKQPLDSVCIHGESYGTVSSTIVALSPDARKTIYLHAEGNPCNAKYRKLSPIF
jgi:uncharacterized protein with NRDE domain